MKETGSPELLFVNLDLTPIQPILWRGLHRQGPGRPVKYNPESDLRALMLRQLEHIPYIKDLVKRLRREPYLRRVCGYGDEVPTEATSPLLAAGLVQASAIDSADLPAWSSRDPKDNLKGLGDPRPGWGGRRQALHCQRKRSIYTSERHR